jgi:hypothetical protein
MSIQALHDDYVFPPMEREEKSKKRIKKRIRIPRAPREIIPIKCADKKGVESWLTNSHNSDLGNFPAPMRMLILGPPNVGKSTLIKNIIIHAMPRYREVYLIHEDADYSREYDDLEPTQKMNEIPHLNFWQYGGPYKKRLCIIDDLEFTASHKERLRNLAVLFRYASSHKGLSIILAHQSFFDTPPLVKKMSNVYVIYKPRARNEITMIENRVGLPQHMLDNLFDSIAINFNDSICVDLTKNTPAPLRLNIFTPIEVYDSIKIEDSDNEES